jgi:outer membrane protein assembly factor BamB
LDGKELHLLSVDASTGRLKHDLKLFEPDSLQAIHPTNSFASPSPVVEANHVYAHFGTYGTACIDTESGKVIWKRTDFHCDHEVGPGSSPILYNNLLILTFDGTDVRYLVALNKLTGETVWEITREVDLKDQPLPNRKSFTTPIVTSVNGENQLISVGAHSVMGYNPNTGSMIWRAFFSGFSASACPVVGNNMLFFNSGFSFSSLVALRLGGKGNVTDSIKWINKKNTQARSSALLIDSLLYMVNTGGQAKCFVAETGEEVWTVRVGNQTSASPVFAGGNVYTTDEDGLTTIFKPGRTFRKIAENRLPAGCFASPAVIDHALIIRTKTHLYKIEKKVSNQTL